MSADIATKTKSLSMQTGCSRFALKSILSIHVVRNLITTIGSTSFSRGINR
jgi:hypothetical protein